MSITLQQALFYSGALLVVFLTPGPVWLAMLARTVSGGFAAAWPLALGVALGDAFWSILALVGMSWVVGHVTGFLDILRWVAVGMFGVMGCLMIRHAKAGISKNSTLTRPGRWAGFLVGIVAILGNPKAILFYMGVVPGFFTLDALTALDVATIALLSALVPMIGNLILAACVGQVRRLLSSPRAMARLNRIAGSLMIVVAIVIAFL
ncbi:LysE family translocator [Thioclava litoralis]|uniref:LysE family translocator n=1 Tax=Thioclava litoralis TaxID=3076557 RepID=A0ABZ1DUS7_9RHOB|nr:LysE family translocator [Thioclava sp. FTW29]